MKKPEQLSDEIKRLTELIKTYGSPNPVRELTLAEQAWVRRASLQWALYSEEINLGFLEVNSYQLKAEGFHADVRLERLRNPNGTDHKWVIRESGFCFTKNIEWELEPLPSRRTQKFLANSRWDSAEDALLFWMSFGYSQYEETEVKNEG